MYRVINATSGEVLGVFDHVTYIKVGASGCNTFATKDDATGVAINSVPYDLLGHDEINGEGTVIVSEFDGGALIDEQQRIIDHLLLDTLEERT